MDPVAGSAATWWVDPSSACVNNPSAAAHMILSCAHPTSVGAGVRESSSVLPDAKVNTSTLPARMYARRSPVGESAGEDDPSGAMVVTAPPLAGTTFSAP